MGKMTDEARDKAGDMVLLTLPLRHMLLSSKKDDCECPPWKGWSKNEPPPPKLLLGVA